MKRIILFTIAALSCAMLSLSCTKEDPHSGTYPQVKVNKVFLHTAKSIRELDVNQGARLGTMIRLEGENFYGVKKITVNGSPAYLNPNLITANSIIFRIPTTDANNATTPTGSECPEEIRDLIVISSNGNADFKFPFHVMGSAPSITGLSHTLPSVGSWVTVYGTSLKGVKKVNLIDDTGNVVAETTEVRGEDAKGTKFQFKMPEVVRWSEIGEYPAENFSTCYEGGYLLVETGNGNVASANDFYRQKNVFLNNGYSQSDAAWGTDLYTYNPDATNNSYYAWGSGISGDLPNSTDSPQYDPFIAKAAAGDGPQAPEKFRAMPELGTKIPVIALSDGRHSADGGACIARACFNSDACSGRALGMADGANLTSGITLFTSATSTDKLAVEFDYFIPSKWDSGRIAFTFVDNGVNWMAHFHPWTTDPDTYANGMTEWRTAVIPLSQIPNFANETYGAVLKNTIKGVNGEYACQGMLAFYNDECDGKPAHEYAAEDNFVVFYNNFRIVPYETIEIENEE